MKKLSRGLFITILFVGVFLLTGCNNKGEKEKNSEEVKQTTDEDADKTEEDDKNNTEAEVTVALENQKNEDEPVIEEEYIPDFIHQGEPFDYTQYNFYDADLYVKAPAYHEVSDGLQNFHFGNKVNIAYYAGLARDMDGIEKIEDIIDVLLVTLIRGSSRYMYGEFDYFEFDSEEKVMINDIEMMRYEGNIYVKEFKGDEKKRYVVIYTFIHNGTPNAIFGYAGDTDQSSEDINEMIHNIDESVKTIVPKNYLVK